MAKEIIAKLIARIAIFSKFILVPFCVNKQQYSLKVLSSHMSPHKAEMYCYGGSSQNIYALRLSSLFSRIAKSILKLNLAHSSDSFYCNAEELPETDFSDYFRAALHLITTSKELSGF